MVTSWKLYDAIRGMASGGDRSSTTTAVYVGRDSDGRDVVRLKGSGIATPVNGSMSASAREGDTLSVDVSNGRLSVVGNLSDPGVGGEYVSEAVGASESAVREDMGQISTIAEGAAQTARGAASIANATAQHFWVDGQGVHVTQVTQDEFLQEPEGPNQLSNANGILLRDGETYLASFATDGMSVYDGRGNEASNSVAEFTREGMRVGYEGRSKVSVTPERTTFTDADGLTIGVLGQSAASTVEQAHTLDWTLPGKKTSTIPLNAKVMISQENPLTVQLTSSGITETVTFTETGTQDSDVGPVTLSTGGDYDWSVVISSLGYGSYTARVTYYKETYLPSYVFGTGSASGSYALSEGAGTTAAGNFGSHAEGFRSTASGKTSHAEGTSMASGHGSHAEGGFALSSTIPLAGSTASGINAHAENSSTASGENSHSEGTGEASAPRSHAQNRGTIAASADQTALGRWNVEDQNGDYAVILGNGTSGSMRSNALTVDWSGNVECGTVNGIDVVSAITGVAQFQGELDSQATLEAADYEAGWFWVVTAAGTYAGNACEQGDMVYAVADRGEAYAASDFVVAQANLGPTTNLSNIDIDQICV